MAELVDALGSGPSASNGVEVRVLFWAPSALPADVQQVILQDPCFKLASKQSDRTVPKCSGSKE